MAKSSTPKSSTSKTAQRRSKPTASGARRGRNGSSRASPTAAGTTIETAAKATEQSPEGRFSKQARMLSLLSRPDGASLGELMQASGWQAHSIRGFLSGTVGKRLGHTDRSVKADGRERRYHVEG